MKKITPEIVIPAGITESCFSCPFYEERMSGLDYNGYCNKMGWEKIYDGYGGFDPQEEIHQDCPLETVEENDNANT